LILAKEEAEKSDRLKSEFLAQMSHEIRTPLNNILTYISLLKEEMEDKLPSELEPSFRVINSSALRLIRTIDLILNLSKIQTGNFDMQFGPIDLDNDILYELVLEFYSRASEKDVKLNYKNNAINKKIFGDSYSIGQIFVNLIDNAIKYTTKGEINVILYNLENNVCVDITDSGVGISKEFLPTLFEPFTQEDSSDRRNYEGTGLGLALVKKYVELNNAKIFIKSEKQVGTTFTITFKPIEE
jgi:signal transduction histidine kinase